MRSYKDAKNVKDKDQKDVKNNDANDNSIKDLLLNNCRRGNRKEGTQSLK